MKSVENFGRFSEAKPVSGRARRPDVALFIPDLTGGGAERVMVNIAAGMAARDLAIDLLLVRKFGPYLTSVPDSLRIVELPGRGVSVAPFGLRRYLNQGGARVLFSALHHANLAALVAQLVFRAPVQVIPTIHNTFSVERQNPRTVKDRVVHTLVAPAYRHADRIVAVSHAAADDLAQSCHVPRSRIDTIYNPVITNEMFDLADAPADHRWFRPGAPPVVLGIGRLEPQKDFATLIRAFAILRRDVHVRLVILGEGNSRAELEELVSSLGLAEHVDLPGFVQNPYALLRRAAAFVLSSRWEGLPTVLIEALALDTPIVSTDCRSGPREILEDGAYGSLIPIGDHEVMATAMKAALALERVQRSSAAWSRFTREAAIDAYLHVAGFGDHA